MSETIRVIVEHPACTVDVAPGTTLLELARRFSAPSGRPILAAHINNRIKELNCKIYRPMNVRFVDITSFAGHRVYRHTISFILQKAVRDLWPERKLYIRHSLGQSGYYCEIAGGGRLTAEELESVRRRMHCIVEADLPIRRSKLPTDEVRRRYAGQGMTDRIELLDTRPRLYSDLYMLDDTVGYFYGALAPSTGYTPLFDLVPYCNGFYIALPSRTAPQEIRREVRQEKMFGIFRQYKQWIELMGVPTIGALNAKVLAGEAGELIKVAEAFHERQLAQIADAVARANEERGTRMVLISGPSSSGKTTTAKRLGIQLSVLGLRPVLISLDDYFVDREKTPRDENGEYDYEALEAIDLKLLDDHLRRLFRGEEVAVPRYDFITGRSEWHRHPLRMDERTVLVVEGIHGLNPRLTPGIAGELKYGIYVSCFTSVSMDNTNPIATTDNRLLRRMVRDYATRGSDALSTLSRWASVRRGEERHIFPYQEHADVMFNSSLFYEISVLRPYAERILREVPDTVPEYAEARRMLKFLDNFIPVPPDEIPHTSVLREFIGGSTFKY